MAFDNQKLTPHDAASKGSKLWTYSSATDNKAAIKGTGYFNGAANKLQTGDTIMLTATDATFQAKISVSAGVVTLAALDAFA